MRAEGDTRKLLLSDLQREESRKEEESLSKEGGDTIRRGIV